MKHFTALYVLINDMIAGSEIFLKQLDYITENYFYPKTMLFVYWGGLTTPLSDTLIRYWVTSELVTFEMCNCDLVTDKIIWTRSYVESTVIFFGDKLPSIGALKKIRQCQSWNSRSKILGIITIDEKDVELCTTLLSNIWTLTKAINVTIMMILKSSIHYYTSYPYENFKIAEMQINDLFPEKPLNNLHGAVLTVAAIFFEPYVLKPDTEGSFEEGLEIRIMNTLAERYNFQLKFVKPPSGENPWVLMTPDERKMIGNFGVLNRFEADLLFHGVQIRYDRCVFGDMTGVHTYDRLVWVAPQKSHSYGWNSMIIVFSIEIWTNVIISLFFISVGLYLVTRFDFRSGGLDYRFYDGAFQALSIFLLVPLQFYRKGFLYRFYMVNLFFYATVIVNLYQSSLVSFLTTPESGKQYDRVADAVDDNLVGYLFPGGKSTYNITDHGLWNKILAPGRHVYMDDSTYILNTIAYNKTIYTQLMKNVVDFEVNRNLLDEAGKSMVHVLPEAVLPYMVSIFTSRGHPLAELIRTKVLQLLEGGFMKYWMKDISLKNFIINRGIKSKGKGPVSLTLDHLRGALYIIPFFSVISSTVFLCEVICHRYVSKLNFSKMYAMLVRIFNRKKFVKVPLLQNVGIDSNSDFGSDRHRCKRICVKMGADQQKHKYRYLR